MNWIHYCDKNRWMPASVMSFSSHLQEFNKKENFLIDRHIRNNCKSRSIKTTNKIMQAAIIFPSNSTCRWSHKKGKHLGRVGLFSWDRRNKDSKDISLYFTSCFENIEIHYKTTQRYIYFISLSLSLHCFCLSSVIRH